MCGTCAVGLNAKRKQKPSGAMRTVMQPHQCGILLLQLMRCLGIMQAAVGTSFSSQNTNTIMHLFIRHLWSYIIHIQVGRSNLSEWLLIFFYYHELFLVAGNEFLSTKLCMKCLLAMIFLTPFVQFLENFLLTDSTNTEIT